MADALAIAEGNTSISNWVGLTGISGVLEHGMFEELLDERGRS
jgi:hypothetical protein